MRANVARVLCLLGFGLFLGNAVVACSDDTGSGGGGGGAACDDGLFCNGVERLVGGKCVTIAENPCDDGQACTTDACDEDHDTCAHTLGADCAACISEACTPDCSGKECGDDGCGSVCGTCGANEGCASITGQCAPADQAGSCGQPRPLTVAVGDQIVMGDSTMGIHQATPTCNSTSTAVEDVYTFTLTERLGIEAQSYGYDTVLHLRTDCTDDSPAATIACSDDSAPPGNYGSRITAMLDPGTYFLIVDGFDSTQYGPYELKIRAAADCTPHCDGVYCGGDNGCGGDCGTCPMGEACGPDFQCRPDPCTPDCTNDDASQRVCGDDGCLGSCGECAEGSLCVPSDGQCGTFAACDHDNPTCAPACGNDEYCGVDCACHTIGAALPDLVVSEKRLKDEILFDEVDVSPLSCASVEQCVNGTGKRRVMRFSVEAINQGQATLTVPTPDTRPDMFHYSSCHGHYHFNGFALYELLDANGTVVMTGNKQAYCMEDTVQVMEGPGVGCNKMYDCSNQGIQAGWSDLYGNTLDCQWLDITDVPAGDYQLRVTLNPNHSFEEVSLDNNAATVPVTIE